MSHVPAAPAQPARADLSPEERSKIREERTRRNGHRGAVVWFTGLSGAGKSTLSLAVDRALFALGRHTYVLDGDILRTGLTRQLGFSREDRQENIRRAAEVARILADAGLIAITAFISPFQEDRQRAREIVTSAGLPFVEVFVSAPLEVCEQRDVKGLYRRARAGELGDFTGITSPYDEPTHPEIIVHTDRTAVADGVSSILEYLGPVIAA